MIAYLRAIDVVEGGSWENNHGIIERGGDNLKKIYF